MTELWQRALRRRQIAKRKLRQYWEKRMPRQPRHAGGPLLEPKTIVTCVALARGRDHSRRLKGDPCGRQATAKGPNGEPLCPRHAVWARRTA